MKQRVLIFASAAAISLALVLVTLKMVSYYVDLVYGPMYPFKHLVTWLVK